MTSNANVGNTTPLSELLAQALHMANGSDSEESALLADAFDAVTSAEAKITATNAEIKHGVTWNGDINYADLGSGFIAALLGLSQSLVNDQVLENTKYSMGKNGGGSKRKKQAQRPNDPILNIPQTQRDDIEAKVSSLFDMIRGKPINEQAIYLNLMFRFLFKERAITAGKRSSTGKGHRSLSYFLFTLFYKEMPETCLALIPHFVHYGYFGDLDALCAHYIAEPSKAVVTTCANTYVKALDQDVREIYGAGISSKFGDALPHSEMRSMFKTFRDELQNMTPDAIVAKYDVKLSNAAKWLKSPGKHNSAHQPFIVATIFCPDGGMTEMLQRGSGFVKFCQTTMRYLVSSLRMLLKIPECRMARNQWSYINPSHLSAGAAHKHRRAFLNEDMDVPVPASMSDEGNRTTHPDRIDLRKRVLATALDGALKGAGMDSSKFADAIWSKMAINSCGRTTCNISSGERAILHAQFMAVVEDIRKIIQQQYDKDIAEWDDSNPLTKPLDPFNIFATIDTSGSMSSNNVMHYAIINGIIVTLLSNLGRSFMTFNSTPKIIKLRNDGDIVDWITQVAAAPWGGSTDIDKANKLLIKLMKDIRKRVPTFNGKISHVIFTDGQFNSQFCVFPCENRLTSYYTSDPDVLCKQWNTYAERMKARFVKEGFAMPQTNFWNMTSKAPGFPAHLTFTGLTLSAGVTTGCLADVMRGVSYIIDESGAVVAKVDPEKSFLASLAQEDFDRVSATVFSVGEGVFATEINCLQASGFIDAHRSLNE